MSNEIKNIVQYLCLSTKFTLLSGSEFKTCILDQEIKNVYVKVDTTEEKTFTML